MSKKNSGNLSSILVLTVICLVISAALVGTYQLTEPIIAANKAVGNEELAELLPESNGALTAVVTEKLPGVLEILGADNGEGYIFTVTEKGFGGEMNAMVGVNKEGKVTGIKIIDHGETPNLGTQAFEPDYLDQFLGSASITLKGEEGKTQIDAVTGATVSSTAVFRFVDAALQQFQKMGGGV